MLAATVAIVVASAGAPAPDPVPALVQRLKTGTPGERVIAAEALGARGPAAAAATPALAAAARETKTPRPRSRRDDWPKPGTREHGERYLFFAACDALVQIG